MPIEIRVMMYTDQEVIAALSVYFRRAGRPLAVGTVRSFKVEDEASMEVGLSVETVDGEIVDHKINETDLTAALLMDVVGRKVQLPSDSNKRLYMIADHVSLVVDQRRDPQEAARRARDIRLRNAMTPVP